MWIWIGVGVVLVILMVVYERRPRGWNGKWMGPKSVITIDGLSFKIGHGNSVETNLTLANTPDPNVRMLSDTKLTLVDGRTILMVTGNLSAVLRRI